MRLIHVTAFTLLTALTALAQESPWRAEVLIESEPSMGGAAIVDADSRDTGNELVGVGMVRGEESLTGPELVTCGHGGKLVALIPAEPK